MVLKKPCVSCGRPGTLTGRCPACTDSANRLRDALRGTPADRGYDAEHRRRAAALRAAGLPCCLCGGPIDYRLRSPHPQSFVAHHLTRDKRGPIGPAHRVCNEREGQPS